MQDNQKNITSAIIIAGLIIAGAVLLKDSQPPATTNQNSATFAGRTVAVNSDHILGDPNAPIVIVEYSDFECPFCKTFHNTMHRVVNDNNGKVAWVFRQYPIPQLHPKAFKEAEATECAFEQGGNDAFWKYADKIFEITPSNNRLDEKELPKIAGEIGLNVASFNECLASGKYQAKVQADIDDGVKAGAKGTPYSLIIAKDNITAKTQNDILTALNIPTSTPLENRPISFSSTEKNMMSMNGALPENMVSTILSVLLK